MKNSIIIEEIENKNNSIFYRYSVKGPWKEVFTDRDHMTIEYSLDVSGVPQGIAVVPFLANLLPMAWLYDAEITVPVCDKVFYDSIPQFKKGYCEMYPMMEFRGKLLVGKLEENKPSASDRMGTFFSGGVDAFNTLVCHLGEKPVLLTLWGADVKLDDEQGWQKVLTHLHDTSLQFDLDFVTIKSEFRMFQEEGVLTKAVLQSGDGWWHGFQHGIGIICHAAPAAWELGLSTIYFASSFTEADKGKVTCASDPTIDNYVSFGGTHIVHDGYEFTRQMKVHNITAYVKQSGVKIPLRVCWESTGGSNCCRCEKCWRTMLAIYAEKQNPREYGFDYTEKQLAKLAKKMRYSNNKMFSELRYAPIQSEMQKNCKIDELPKQIQWFYNARMNTLGQAPVWIKCARKVKQGLKKVVRSILN